MTAHLDIDIGNSRIKWRLRHKQSILVRGAVPHQDFSFEAIAASLSDLEQVNVACVAGGRWVEQIAREVEQKPGVRLFVARSGVRFGRLKSAYQDPNRLGVDRWLAMVGASARVSQAFCVVSCGTAITIDYVDQSGQHEGGLIIPGLRLQREALQVGTDAVRVDQQVGEARLGASTTSCALNGIFMALTGGVASILRAREACGSYRHLFTGGDAELFLNKMPFPCLLEQDLVLDGLAIVADSAD